ncbi:MAG: glycosyltransferase [Alphaproteobacteria bacterium]|nr:glycosyltransferase [Alphaproteobacteria bacterium]MBU1561633.1 glycosyltransferase [Alphaproteobacteria bacterium]MBU2302386.1 glycosyltransferase [Alphaproteobacteria bacterium]MBU2368666.1 glycosyltransferase [Alphaproteobacteria bacterium]
MNNVRFGKPSIAGPVATSYSDCAQAKRAGWQAVPQISVILPTYNRLRTLPAAISSVLTQSVKNLELIVVDDASSEDIEGLIASIGDPRVTYIRRPSNGGAGAARNTGLSLAKGQYIAFQDSDDLWLPGKLEFQLAVFADLPREFGAITGPKILHGRDGSGRFGPDLVYVTPSAVGRLPCDVDQVDWLLRDNRLSVQCAMFRSDCMPTRSWFDPVASANEDYEFAVRLAQVVRILEYATPLVLGSVSVDSISRSRRRQTLGEIRIMKNNRKLLQRYATRRAMLMRNLAGFLVNDSKPRLAAKFLLASVALDPPSVLAVAGIVLRKFLKSARQSSLPKQRSLT